MITMAKDSFKPPPKPSNLDDASSLPTGGAEGDPSDTLFEALQAAKDRKARFQAQNLDLPVEEETQTQSSRWLAPHTWIAIGGVLAIGILIGGMLQTLNQKSPGKVSQDEPRSHFATINTLPSPSAPPSGTGNGNASGDSRIKAIKPRLNFQNPSKNAAVMPKPQEPPRNDHPENRPEHQDRQDNIPDQDRNPPFDNPPPPENHDSPAAEGYNDGPMNVKEGGE
ncbi:hypothetical protein WDW86_12295 [Bdellovibrionota bacterium FG-2]